MWETVDKPSPTMPMETGHPMCLILLSAICSDVLVFKLVFQATRAERRRPWAPSWERHRGKEGRNVWNERN